MVRDDRVASVVLKGDLDIDRRDEIVALLPSPNRAERVVIDCTEVNSIDSVILTVLMRYRNQFVESGHSPFDLVVVVNPSLRRIFEITGLTAKMSVVTASAQASSDDKTAPA